MRKVLDHGHVELIETWGSDQRVIESARMSTQKGFLGWGGDPCPRCREAGRLSERDNLFHSFEDSEAARAAKCPCKGTGRRIGDEGLLRYLYENQHSTPFEFAGMVVEVQAPIFVFREWHRHRTQSYNEMSARYAPLPDLAYLPDAADCVKRSEAAAQRNRQAGVVDGAPVLSMGDAGDLLAEESDLLVMVEDLYQRKLKAGFTKELARTHLTVSRYSRMRATANLRNWLGFMTLRSTAKNPAAQQEIRQYADAVGELLAESFPRTWALFSVAPR